MFHGNDPDGQGYSTRAHLDEVFGILGPPPIDMLERGKRSHEFFTGDGNYKSNFPSIKSKGKKLTILEGKWKQDIVPKKGSLETSEEFLEGEDKEMFLTFMRGMFQWRPEDRKTAKDLLQDPWLNTQTK